MSDGLSQALKDPGPHTVASLASRLPAFSAEVIRDALEALAQQGVLERVASGEETAYRYIAPERYALGGRTDVIVNPGAPHNGRPR